jgi:hypothetical protein
MVHDAVKGDVYKDIVRIHWRERGELNRIGAIVSISVDDGPRHFFSLRGLPDEDKGIIRFDHVTRTELRLKIGEQHNFAIEETNAWQKLLWAIHATDPVARIATWIAVWSAILGVLGLILGALGVWPVVKEWIPRGKTEQHAAQ